ncbi:MAG: glycosyltransferase family 39 protein [Methanobacteriota archaeon]
MERNKSIGVFCVIFLALLSFGLRIIGGVDSSLFYDEVFFVDVANHPPWSQFRAYTDPPIITTFLFLVKSFVGTSEVIFRLPSIILGSLTVVLTYLFGREISGRNVGFISSILIAFNVFHQQYSQVATTHVYLTFFIVLALYGIRKNNGVFIYTGIIGGLYTNDLAILLLGAYSLSLWQSEGISNSLKRIGLIFFLYLPRVPVLINHFFFASTKRYLIEIEPFFYVETITIHLSLAIVLGFTYYSIKRLSSSEFTVDLLLIWIFIAVSPFFFFFQRYLLFLLPPLTVLGVTGLFKIHDQLRKKGGNIAKAFTVISITFFFIPNPQAYGVYPISNAFLLEEEMIHLQQWGEAALLIDGGVVLVSQNRPSMKYYLDELGKDSQVIQFDSAGELQVKLEIPGVNWVVVRNFENGYEDYEDMRKVMDSSNVFKRAYELEHVVLYERLDK